MTYGKTIELFLVNGSAESLITAELSNWNGKAIKIPRTEVASCIREDVAGAGVYFLFCKEDDGTDSVYIGEGENVIERLKQHLRDSQSGKEAYYWNAAVVFVGNDLNKALIRYLEDRFVKLARECNRYQVLTKNTYSNTVLKESNIATMEEFIDNVKVIINTLGYKVLVPTPEITDETKYLYCKGSEASAKGFLSAEGLVVLKGSKVSDGTAPSLETRSKSYFNLRKRLEEAKIIKDRVFTQNYPFNAPSAASAVILGRPSNGHVDWKTADGTKLKEI